MYASSANKRNPYVRSEPVVKKMPHVVVITGVYIESVTPLKDNVEIKNLWGVEWGTGGYAWVKSNFFSVIGVPVKGRTVGSRSQMI
ncbi:hypothetical protein R6Q59_017229 [Mikania micrantha]